MTLYNSTVTNVKFQILTSSGVAWQSGKDGQVPPEAIVVGRTQDGENLFMGRTFHDGTMTPGKVRLEE